MKTKDVEEEEEEEEERSQPAIIKSTKSLAIIMFEVQVSVYEVRKTETERER